MVHPELGLVIWTRHYRDAPLDICLGGGGARKNCQTFCAQKNIVFLWRQINFATNKKNSPLHGYLMVHPELGLVIWKYDNSIS